MRRAFTLAELLVSIAIIAVLIALLVPVLSRAQKQSRAASCLSNLRQVGLYSAMYANSNRGWPFPPVGWTGQPPPSQLPLLMGFSKTARFYICPDDENPAWDHSYVPNGWAAHWKKSRWGRSDSVLFGEKASHRTDYICDPNDYYPLVQEKRHGTSGILFCDGHAATTTLPRRFPQPDPWY